MTNRGLCIFLAYYSYYFNSDSDLEAVIFRHQPAGGRQERQNTKLHQIPDRVGLFLWCFFGDLGAVVFCLHPAGRQKHQIR